MTLYIANTTKQHQIIPMRFAGREQLTRFDIPAGKQIELKDTHWSEAHQAQVVEHITRFGAVEVPDINQHPETPPPLVFQFGKPVTEDKIQQAHELVVEGQEKRSAAEAVKAGLGFDRAANNGTRGKRLAQVTSVEVIEQSNPREKPTGKEVKFSMSVDPEGGNIKLPA